MSIDLSDVLILSGAGLLLYGAWLVSLALFFMVLGVLLLLAGIAQARNRTPQVD
jgi:hypothetical protein